MSSEIRHAAIREIEKAGGTVRCAIRDGESVVTVTDPNGTMVKVTNAFSFDLEQALTLYRGARVKWVKAPEPPEAVEAPRARRKARTRVSAHPSPAPAPVGEKSTPGRVETERLSLKERLKLRNQERVA